MLLEGHVTAAIPPGKLRMTQDVFSLRSPTTFYEPPLSLDLRIWTSLNYRNTFVRQSSSSSDKNIVLWFIHSLDTFLLAFRFQDFSHLRASPLSRPRWEGQTEADFRSGHTQNGWSYPFLTCHIKQSEHHTPIQAATLSARPCSNKAQRTCLYEKPNPQESQPS